MSKMVNRQLVGVIYNQKAVKAKAMAEKLWARLGGEGRAWLCSAAELEKEAAYVKNTSLMVTVGGDGTILRAARAAAPHSIPIVGVNMGRVGFMTELAPEEALERIEDYMAGKGWIEERAMLQAVVYSQGAEQKRSKEAEIAPFHALNDVVVGRGPALSMIFVETYIYGARLTTYAADAVIVATATGSTGYSLAAGGPILHPQAKAMLLKPLASHLSLGAALVLPEDAVIEMRVQSESPAVLSVDGFQNSALGPGDTVRVQRSPYTSRFLRSRPPSYFYESLLQRLRRIP